VLVRACLAHCSPLLFLLLSRSPPTARSPFERVCFLQPEEEAAIGGLFGGGDEGGDAAW
jgi:hypothetical protein